MVLFFLLSMLMLPTKIEQWLKNNYCPQRLLLSGPNGLAVAFEIAKRYGAVDAKMLAQNIHTDTLILRDEGTSFKIGEDQSRDPNSARGLITWVSQKPVAKHRLIILENFERASREAPQALLKILEEPPPQALFLFTTQNHHRVHRDDSFPYDGCYFRK